MDKIIPRWEWRSFGQHFGEAEARMAALTPEAVQESDEVYLLPGAGLSAASGNVKVRAELMDIKILQQVNADGLEQWTPVMKAGFPLQRVMWHAFSRRSNSRCLRFPAPATASMSLWPHSPNRLIWRVIWRVG